MDKKSIISKMTLRQKADLMTGKDFWQTKDYEEYQIPSLFLSDGPHGLRKQAAAADHLGLNASIPATCFPTAATMANSWDIGLGEQMGEALGEEAASMNVNVLLGPGVCMKRNPRCGRNFEYFSEDPYLAGKMAAAYIRGIQQNGTAACVKHFAANNQEERRMVSDSVIDERALREIYLTAFEIAVKEGKARTVMSSYNKVNGVFSDENKHLIRDILRGEWGFDGAVISDWAGTNNKVASVEAGSDIEMPGCRYGADDIVKAVEEGRLDISYVDESVERILSLIEDTTKKNKKGEKGFDKDAHHALAQRCAEESIVLLENDGVLPFKGGEKVAVIGDFADKPRYQGAGSSIVNPTKLDTVNNLLKDYGINNTGYEKGYDRYGKSNKRYIERAVNLAGISDVVVMFLGLDEVSEAEGIDRSNIDIPANQIELYNAIKATGKKIVTVLSCGSCVDLKWAEGANALVYACLSGQAGATAILNVLCGKVNPCGKLAETFVENYGDCPSASHFPGSRMTVEYRESLYIGYRYYDTAGIKVKYPFGYGLSYTEYGYSDLKIDEKGVSFTITNQGGRDGYEIAQLYVGKPDGEVFRPAKELKGFKKVFIKAGESVRVEIPFDDKTFRYFNVKTDKWEVEGGEYALYIGASSADIKLSGKKEMQGTTDILPYDREKLPSYFSGRVADVQDGEFTEILGREIPKADYTFYKKNRMVIDENSTVSDLRYSRRWIGRLFSWVIRAVIAFDRAIGKRTSANTLVMGMLHQPMRGIAKFGGFSRRQLEAFIDIFNGHFFKGAFKFLTKEKKKKGVK